MPQPYPYPSAINGSVDILTYTNTITDGWMIILFSIALVVIMFVTLKNKNYKTGDSLLVSFILVTILNSFLWLSKLMQGKIVVIFLLLTIASGIYSAFDN